MIINMTTIAVRQRHYIDRTLESLLRSDGRDVMVNLILGSSDTSHVEKYRGRFNIVPWDEESEAQARAGRMRHNCNLNAIRSLKYGDDEHCLCIEDDINFVADWYSRLLLTIAEIPDEDYVLNLGQGCDQSPDKRYATHTQPYLCGAQAIFYPSKGLRRTIAAYLEHNITRGMNDTLVGQYAKQFAALYNTTPVLVGHIGQVSSFSQPAEAEKPAPKPAAPRRDVAPARPVATRDSDSAGDVARTREIARATSATLVDLVRASLGSGALPDARRLAECDWRGLFLLASHHGLAPTLYHALRDHAGGVPPERHKRLKALYAANVFRNQLFRAGVEEIGAAFAREQIPFVVTGRATLACAPLGDPGLGAAEPIGLLVGEGDVERAGAPLRQLGYAPREGEVVDRRGRPSRMHLGYRRPRAESVPLDLHWRLVEPYQPYLFEVDEVRAQARALPGLPPHLPAMSPEHELAFLCLQAERRAGTYRSLIHQPDWLELLLLPRGAGRLVALCDIALLLQQKSPGIDWDAFVATARRWCIDGRVHATLELCRRALGIGPPAEVLRQLDRSRPQLSERIAHRLSFASDRTKAARWGGSPSTPRSRWLADWSTPLLRAARVWTSVFPPQAYLRAKYPAVGTPLASRRRHVRDLVPDLWEEARYRFDLGGAGARPRGRD